MVYNTRGITTGLLTLSAHTQGGLEALLSLGKKTRGCLVAIVYKVEGIAPVNLSEIEKSPRIDFFMTP